MGVLVMFIPNLIAARFMGGENVASRAKLGTSNE